KVNNVLKEMERSLELACGSELWNPRTVFESNPDFTFCFQYTLLIWAPCLFLWCAAPLWIFMLSKPSSNKIKISYLFISKLFATTCLIFIELINLYYAFDESNKTVFYITPIILISTYILVIFILHLERKSGRCNSSILFIYWLIMTLASSITLRSKLIFHFGQKSHEEIEKRLYKLDEHDIYLFYVTYIFICLNTILSTFSERVFYKIVLSKNSPEQNSSLLSRLTFWWINPLISTGYKRDLVRDDLFEIDDKELSEASIQKLEKIWNPLANDYIKKVRALEDNKTFIINESCVRNDPAEKINLEVSLQ
ncbi:unnamed protein product, partial [Brachionus calyciflorus]